MKFAVNVPAFLPDQSANSGILHIATNVYPAVDGYRPVKAPSVLSAALTSEFLGGGSFIASSGASYLLAGTTTKLCRLASGAWTDLKTGLTINNRWKFVQFGDFVVAVNGAATRQVDLIAGTDSALGAAPTGTDICVVGDWVVIAQPNGNLLKVRWSAFNDHTAWTIGTDQSGEQVMNTGGEVMGLAGGEYGVILQRFRLVRMSRTGDATAPFQFDEISPNYGCAAKGSIAQAGRSVFFLSDRGFMALDDGQALRPIGSEKVDRTFASLVTKDDYGRVWSVVDPANKLVMWGVEGGPGTIWVYNFELDKWSTISTPFSGLFAGYTSSLTLEEVSALYPDIDAMPYSLDDPRFSGGDPRLYLVDADGALAVFGGDNLTATFGYAFAQINKGGVARLRNVRPVTDAVAGVTTTVDARARLGDAANERTVTELRPSGIMPIRHSGRHMKLTHVVADPGWSYYQGAEFDYDNGGER